MLVNRFTKVTHQSWRKNIFNSFVGALIGVLLFFGAFVVLWVNEGKINWAQVAGTSLAVDATSVNGSSDGKFVAATGILLSPEQIGDEPYLRAGAYLKLERKVEMFAWQEHQDSETKKEFGGGSTTRTTYAYTKDWTDHPQDTGSFEIPQNHANPTQKITNAAWTVASGHVGAYQIDPAQLDMPRATVLNLNPDMVMNGNTQQVRSGYLFAGNGTPDAPYIGDLRIQYMAVPNNIHATVFGTQQGSTIVPYLYRGDSLFYQAFKGERATAIAQLQTEHSMLTWILRLVGLLMMWLGMSMILGPITAFLNVLPVLGTLSGWVTGMATFGIALVLSIITIVLSMIAHSLIALSILLLLIVGGVFLWSRIQNRHVPVPAT